MSKKILTRLALFLLVLFGVTILTFIYTNLSPVDAAEALAVRRYSRPTPEQVELVREELGLDKPLVQQYGSWLWNALHGDFGNSYNTGRPIIEELTASLGPTITMASLALLFAAIFSIPLGVLSASKKGGLFDKTIYLFGIVSMSLPYYWIGFMLLLAFSVQIPIFSIMGADNLKDFILPALYGHVDGINDAHVVLFACVNGFFLQVQLLDLVRRNAQLPRSGLHEPGHVAVRRQREIADADHRGDLHVWEFSLSYHRTGKNGNQKTAAPDFTKCSRKRRERQYNIHYIVSEGSALLLWQKRS